MRRPKTLILFLIILGFTTFSCTDDDHDDAQNRDIAKFAGTWMLQKNDNLVGLTDKFKTELEANDQKKKIVEYENAMKKLLTDLAEEMKPVTLVLDTDGKFEYSYSHVVDGKSTEVKQNGTFGFNATYTEIILKTTSVNNVADRAYVLVGTSLLRQDDKKTAVMNSVEGLEYETVMVEEKEVEKVKIEKAIQGLVFAKK